MRQEEWAWAEFIGLVDECTVCQLFLQLIILSQTGQRSNKRSSAISKMAGLPLNESNNVSGAEASETTPLTVSNNMARSTFLSGNAEASRFYHENKHDKGHAASEEGHQTEGGFLKPIIFGGLDGILTSFAIVAGAAGGRLDPSVVLILGFR